MLQHVRHQHRVEESVVQVMSSADRMPGVHAAQTRWKAVAPMLEAAIMPARAQIRSLAEGAEEVAVHTLHPPEGDAVSERMEARTQKASAVGEGVHARGGRDSRGSPTVSAGSAITRAGSIFVKDDDLSRLIFLDQHGGASPRSPFRRW